MTLDDIGRRVVLTLYNPSSDTPLLGLRGIAFLVIALVPMVNWRWDWSAPASYLMAVALPALFAIGAVTLTKAWQRTAASSGKR